MGVTWFTSRGPDGRWSCRPLPGARAAPASGPTYIAGLDLGKMADYTALTILERHPPAEAGGRATYLLRFLRRWPLKTLYPTIVAEVAGILARPPLGPTTDLLIDHGGVGVAVADQFRLAGLPAQLKLVTITGGDQVHQQLEQGVPHYAVPKRELVASITILLQQDRLKIAPELAEAKTLVSELGSFEVKVSDSGHDSYNARSGAHDDLVLSVALAAWFGEQPRRAVYVW